MAGAVEELDVSQSQDEDHPIGEPFAVAFGCDLMPAAAGVPGCYASVKCDCGRAFKVDLLSEGVKPCPGCKTPYSHVLVVAPSDDPEAMTAFLDELHGDVDDDDGDEQLGNNDDEPTDGPKPWPADDDDHHGG